MITILKSTQSGLSEITDIQPGCWVNVMNPGVSELETLSRELSIPIDILHDPMDLNERSRIEVEDGWTLIVVRVSVFNENGGDVQYTTIPLGIIYNKAIILTICLRNNEIISDFSNCKIKNFSTENISRFILQICLRTSLLYLKHLKEINEKTGLFENELHKAMKNEQLIKLLNMEKSLVFFTTSLRSNELLLERLQSSKHVDLNVTNADLFEDVVIETRQAIEMANVYSNILSGMMDAFASVISNNLNVVLKFLTAITIILMIPTLMASIYGMNVELPFQHSQDSFLIVMSISFILSALSVLIFLRRDWF